MFSREFLHTETAVLGAHLPKPCICSVLNDAFLVVTSVPFAFDVHVFAQMLCKHSYVLESLNDFIR